jgi:hypothetical protein
MATAKKTPAVIPLTLAIREAHDWCETAIFQGARLTELLDNQIAFDHANAMAAEWRALRAANHLPSGARVEVVECYFFIAALRHVLSWMRHFTRHKNRPTKELRAAMKEFVSSVPRPPVLKLVEQDYTISGNRDLPPLDLQMPGATPFKAQPGREYVMAGSVSLPGTLARLRKLAPVLAAARASMS